MDHEKAIFIFFGDQDGKLLWELDSYTASSDSTCGAYVAPGVWKEFDCYNLAAIGKTTGDDPFTPSWRLIGGYWQWGRKGPDESQWDGVINNNTQRDVGTWAESITNYSTASFFGDALMLPAAGYRYFRGGTEHLRGSIGSYWTSVSPLNDGGFYGFILDIYGGSARTSYVSRRDGRSVRCVSE